MEHAFIVHLYYPHHMHFNMPYLFTSEKEAYTYGEYSFREDADLIFYEVERIHKPDTFYKLE